MPIEFIHMSSVLLPYSGLALLRMASKSNKFKSQKMECNNLKGFELYKIKQEVEFPISIGVFFNIPFSEYGPVENKEVFLKSYHYSDTMQLTNAQPLCHTNFGRHITFKNYDEIKKDIQNDFIKSKQNTAFMNIADINLHTKEESDFIRTLDDNLHEKLVIKQIYMPLCNAVVDGNNIHYDKNKSDLIDFYVEKYKLPFTYTSGVVGIACLLLHLYY